MRVGVRVPRPPGGVDHLGAGSGTAALAMRENPQCQMELRALSRPGEKG